MKGYRPAGQQYKYIDKLLGLEVELPKKTIEYPASNWIITMLRRNTNRDQLLLNQLDQCLELAYRKNIVNNDVRSRLVSREFEATFAELKVAKLVESLGNNIEFYPPGRNGKVLEFKAIGRRSRCFVEVKSLGDSEKEKRELDVLFKLHEVAASARLPYRIQFVDYSTDKEFRKRDLARWIKSTISEMEKNNQKNGRFVFDRGFKVTMDIEALRTANMKKDISGIPPILFVTEKDETIWLCSRISSAVHDAVRQLDKIQIPCLVVINSPGGHGLFDEELQGTLYGRRYADVSFPLPDKMGAVFPASQNTRVSAVGIYSTGTGKGALREELEIYHNPHADVQIDMSMFGSKVVTHFSVSKTSSRIKRI